MRALPLALLLAACAAQPLAPLPDSAGPIGMEPCHAIPESAYQSAPGASSAAGAIGDVAVSAKGPSVNCRRLNDASVACDVRGEAYLKAGGGAEARWFHVPSGYMGTVNRLNGALVCRMMPA
jgi:hypothetical protein